MKKVLVFIFLFTSALYCQTKVKLIVPNIELPDSIIASLTGTILIDYKVNKKNKIIDTYLYGIDLWDFNKNKGSRAYRIDCEECNTQLGLKMAKELNSWIKLFGIKSKVVIIKKNKLTSNEDSQEYLLTHIINFGNWPPGKR